MSGKGLHFYELKGEYVYFSQGEGQYVRYEIIPVDTKGMWPNVEMEEFYNSFGWEIVSLVHKDYAVLRTTEQNATDPHTDSDIKELAHETVIRKIKKRLSLSLLLGAAVIALIAYFNYLKRFSVLTLIRRGNMIFFFILIFPILIALDLYETLSMIRKIRFWNSEGELSDIRYVPLWQKRAKKYGKYLISLVIWLLVYSPAAEGYYRQIDNVTYPLPLISVYDIFTEDDFLLDNEEQKWGNGSYSVQIQKSVFGEEYKFYQSGYVLAEKEKDSSSIYGRVHFRYEAYDIRTGFLTDRLFEDVYDEYRLKSPDVFEEISDSRFDKLYYSSGGANQYIVARKGDAVLAGMIWINIQDSSEMYSLKDHLDLLYNALTYERR